MMIATEVSVRNADWLARLTASRMSEQTPTNSAGMIGTRARPDTRASEDPNGSRPSRAIENSIRIHAVQTARQHTGMAIAEAIRKMFPRVFPSASLTIDGGPSEFQVWRGFPSVFDPAGEYPRRPKAVHHIRTHDSADEEGAEVAPR